MQDDGIIKHVPSGYCVHPNGGTAEIRDAFVLHPSCDFNENLVFDVTKNGNIKHRVSGMCGHPYLGSATPEEGTAMVFWPSCNETADPSNDRLRFVFERK